METRLSADGGGGHASFVNAIEPQPSHLDRYRRLRTVGPALISKMYEAARAPVFDMLKAARKLTLPVVERTVIFDGETDSTALADFFFHEMRFGGERIVDVLAGLFDLSGRGLAG